MLNQIKADLKSFTLSRESLKVGVLRMLLSEIKYRAIELGRDLTDDEVLVVVSKEAKKRKESMEAFRVARPELALQEQDELGVLMAYLPKQLGDEELMAIVVGIIRGGEFKSISDMGRVIAAVKAQVGQGADGGRIAGMVKQVLSRT